MADVLLDAFIDSLKLLAAVAVCTYIIAFIEPKMSKSVHLQGKLAPLIGVSVSLLPQCGFSVVATDLFQKRHITIGTLVGIYLATSDEALPIFLSYPQKALHILPILGLKFLIGIIAGYALDAVFVKNRRSVEHHLSHCNDKYNIKLMHCESAELVDNVSPTHQNCDCEECEHSDCKKLEICDHCGKMHLIHDECEMEERQGILYEFLQKQKIKQQKAANKNRFLIKPLLHSLEIFAYALVVNFIFAIILYYVGQERIVSFLVTNRYVAPLFSVLVGIIPNCASSIVISELYIIGGLGFGATLGGLCMNAGVALVFLFKKKENIKQNMIVFALLFFISLAVSYIASAACGFGALYI